LPGSQFRLTTNQGLFLDPHLTMVSGNPPAAGLFA
jgi:hypothetical protein